MKQQINEIKRMQLLAGLITESEYQESTDESKIEEGASTELDSTMRDLYTKPLLGGYVLDYSFDGPQFIIHISKSPAKKGQQTKDVEKLGTATCINGKWSFDGVQKSDDDQSTLDKLASLAFPQTNENIHNTIQMGGMVGGRNFSAEAEEDKKAVEDIKAAIANGASEKDAIEQVSKKYKLYSDYLKRKYDQSNKIKEGEAAYEYEKGKAAGKKEEKAKLTKEDLADAEAEKMMDFLAEYEVIYVVENGICYRKDDEGNLDRVDMYYCKRYAGTGVREEKEKEKELKEELSDEGIARLEAEVDNRYLSILKYSLENLVPTLISKGDFDEDDVIDYLTHLVKKSYKDGESNS